MIVEQPVFYTLGFTVYASLEGKKSPQPISQRFTSRSAAETYMQLARKNGFKDAYVHEVEGLEAKHKLPRKKTELHPKE